MIKIPKLIQSTKRYTEEQIYAMNTFNMIKNTVSGNDDNTTTALVHYKAGLKFMFNHYIFVFKNARSYDLISTTIYSRDRSYRISSEISSLSSLASMGLDIITKEIDVLCPEINTIDFISMLQINNRSFIDSHEGRHVRERLIYENLLLP